METPVNCEDKATKKKVKRSIYINNVPDGQIPLVSDMTDGAAMDDFKGLMPGIMSNIAQIKPMNILLAFVTGSKPICQRITMETVDVNNVSTIGSGFVTNSDISVMPASWFPNTAGQRKRDYDLNEKKESFQTVSGELTGSAIDYSKMPDDVGIQFYYSMLGLLGLYFLIRIMLKKKK